MRFKTRLTLAFGLFAFLLCALFALLLDESLTELEDQFVSSLLTQEADYLLARYRENPEHLVMPELDQLKGYLSAEPSLPATLEPLETGYHKTEDYHVLVRDLDPDLRLYLIYDETRGVLDRHETSRRTILAILVLVVSAVGLGLGVYQAGVLARPVNDLVAQVKSVDTEKPEMIPLADKGEIGLLSRAYADLVERLGRFITREKAFTRYASHELKTPLSIIHNNLELLHNEGLDAGLRDRAVERLQEATRQMQRQIEIFLMLAREDRFEPGSQPLDWKRLWDSVQAQFPQVSLSLEISQEPEVFVNEAVVETILVNILSNVAKHGALEQGATSAWARLETGSLGVGNPVSRSKGEDTSDYGFGLEINRKLCEAAGWRFATRQEDGEFIVTIRFDPVDD